MDKIRLDRILSDLKHGDLIDTSLTELECIEIIERNKELENKKVDLYEILLDSFIEILKQHGVTEVCILNEFTRSIENQCQQALPPADKEEVCGCGCRGIHHDLEKAKNVCEQCGNKIKEDSNA